MMQKNTFVKQVFIVASIAAILLSGCVSKRYVKKGIKFEQAGLWEMAADAYLTALMARRDNIDAIIGLKRCGQRVLDERSGKIIKAYENDDLQQTVYLYVDAEKFKNTAAGFGVELSVSALATDYFNDAKIRYIENIYAQAVNLLENEKFKQAEHLFSEIKNLDPNFGDVNDKLLVSKLEPLYRDGKKYMETGYFRRAYACFDQILRETDRYKDVRELREQALWKAMITIKIDDFATRHKNHRETALSIQQKVAGYLIQYNNPFIKVLNESLTARLIEQQQRAVHSFNELEIGRLLAAKAILSGEVNVTRLSEGSLIRTEKKGYLKEVVKEKDPQSGEEKQSVKYSKVRYYVCNQRNEVSVTLNFNLVSTETGAVLLTDVIRERQSDEINYAVFSGPVNNLVPGYWEYADKDSPTDVVFDNQRDISQLQSLFKARKDIKSVDILLSAVIDEIARKTAVKIHEYNPEQ